MKVQVLSIKAAKEPNSHEVLLSIGVDQQTFIFTTEVNQVGEHQIQTTHGDRTFSEVFRFNQRVAMNVSNLVVKFSSQQIIELPADVGNFVTPEETVSKLKSYEKGKPIQSDLQDKQKVTLYLSPRTASPTQNSSCGWLRTNICHC